MSADDPETSDPAFHAILDARTRALAEPAATGAPERRVQVVDVQVSGEQLSLPAAKLMAIEEMRRLAPLPHAPPEVAGLIWRSEKVLPVFYLHAVMSLPLTALPERARILVLGKQRPELGLVVDAVSSARWIDPDDLSEVSSSLGPVARTILRGVDAAGAGLVDVDALLDLDALVVDVAPPDESVQA